jgi:hypothetical protein
MPFRVSQDPRVRRALKGQQVVRDRKVILETLALLAPRANKAYKGLRDLRVLKESAENKVFRVSLEVRVLRGQKAQWAPLVVLVLKESKVK